MTFWLYYFDKMNILINKISNTRKNIITDEVKIGKKNEKVNLMETIKLPRNLKDINNSLKKDIG